jgi:acetyltransferase-like isoleucine patch superfamily enzyme
VRIFFVKLRSIFYRLINTLLFIKNNVQFYNFYGQGIITLCNNGKCKIGKDFKFNSGKNYNPIGGDIVLRIIVLNNANLEIGNNVGISNTTIYATKSITIGNNVMIGGGCKIWDTDFHSIKPKDRIFNGDNLVISKEIIIEDNVFIGAGCYLLKGITIGKNSIVGAGSVITKNIPENQIWAGNPAKFVKNIEIL